jgi:anti-sigma B factor antagonist
MSTASNKPLRMQVSRHGSAMVLKVAGSASMGEADRLREKLIELAAERAPLVILDLSEMDFISSLGLGAIITGHLKMRHHRGQIRLVNPTPAVRELLETTRLTTLFAVYDSVDKALPKT